VVITDVVITDVVITDVVITDVVITYAVITDVVINDMRDELTGDQVDVISDELAGKLNERNQCSSLSLQSLPSLAQRAYW
jgi:hypothetical protein